MFILFYFQEVIIYLMSTKQNNQQKANKYASRLHSKT